MKRMSELFFLTRTKMNKCQSLLLVLLLFGMWFMIFSKMILSRDNIDIFSVPLTTESRSWYDGTTDPLNRGDNNVVSMSLYGQRNPRYTKGIIRNAALLKQNFPGWILRLYVEKVSEKPKYGKLPRQLLVNLTNMGVDIRYMDPYEAKVAPMMWRFLVADDLNVDHFIVRDCDSRLTARDAAAVREWIKSEKAFHCVRDHPSHSRYSVSGGLWGGMPRKLRSIFKVEFKEMMVGYTAAYVQDMMFLCRLIWPRVKEKYTYCSDSYSCQRFPSSHPFPVKRIGAEHVGQVYYGNDRGRPNDMVIVRRTPVNRKCNPS